MNFAVLFPTCEIGDDPIAVRDFAQAADELGYSKIVVFDHVLGTPHEHRSPALLGPYTERDPFHEALVLLAYIGAIATNVELMTGVLVLPQRQTALLAKQVAELNWLSGGRVTLGVGTGWNYVEYEALGVDFAERGDRMTEQVEVLRKLWSDPVVDFAGRFHRIDRAGLVPLPKAPIPIWFGGAGLPSLRRAAKIGDGYISGAAGYDHVEQLLHLLAQEGRRQADFGMCEMFSYTGGPTAWEERRDAWEKLGGTELCLTTQAPGSGIRGDAPPTFERPEDHITAMETFMETMRS